VYSKTGILVFAILAKITPLAWLTFTAVLTFLKKKISSTAIFLGLYFLIIFDNPLSNISSLSAVE